jgi:hypothetical protein
VRYELYHLQSLLSLLSTATSRDTIQVPYLPVCITLDLLDYRQFLTRGNNTESRLLVQRRVVYLFMRQDYFFYASFQSDIVLTTVQYLHRNGRRREVGVGARFGANPRICSEFVIYQCYIFSNVDQLSNNCVGSSGIKSVARLALAFPQRASHLL